MIERLIIITIVWLMMSGFSWPRQTEQPALKVFIEQDNLYRLTYADLQNAGFQVDGIDPRYLQLLNQGEVIPMTVHGEHDGVFNPEDWVEFYGEGLKNRYTSQNVYWLVLADQPASRMTGVDGTPLQTEATQNYHYTTLHREENHQYWQLLPVDEPTADHWFWYRFRTAPHTAHFTFTVQHTALEEHEATIRFHLFGRTSTEANPDHHTQLLLNDMLIDDAWWDGTVPFTHNVKIRQNLLPEGENTLTLQTLGDTASPVDSMYVNYFEVDYWNSFSAEQDKLFFTINQPGPHTIIINNFSQPTIRLYDITDPLAVTQIHNGVVEPSGESYQLRFSVQGDQPRRYLATASQHTPLSIQLDRPSNWRADIHQADYLIITYEGFAEALTPLIEYRQSQGLRVATIGITDVFDEFNNGIFSPHAVRDFLAYAYHQWQAPAPKYVLLIGDANYDYHDYLETDTLNYLPSYLYKSNVIGQVPTDNWFVSVAGDDILPDMAIGRFPVQTITDTHILVNKTLTYEQNAPLGKWKQQAIFVIDDEPLFETLSEEQINLLPANFATTRIYEKLYPENYDPTAIITDSINNGALLLNYIGHGNITTWGNWGNNNLLRSTDLAGLNNFIYPFLVTGNCSNGYFVHPQQQSLAEAFVVNPHGGIGAWSATGLGYPFWHEELVETLYETIFQNKLVDIGTAINFAKTNTYNNIGWREPIEIFILFGDPALRLPFNENDPTIYLPMVENRSVAINTFAK